MIQIFQKGERRLNLIADQISDVTFVWQSCEQR